MLSTLHTNDAASALTRLLDLGVAPYLVGSTVAAVLAQRLVRKVCPACGEWLPVEPGQGDLLRVFRGRGCPACWNTGYRGRVGLYELLVMDDAIRAAVTQQRTAAELRTLAEAAGMRPLPEDGRRAIRAGLTTTEEVLRATGV